MGAVTTARDALRKDGELVSYKMGAEKIVKGVMVVLDATGYAVNLTDTSGVVFAGVAYETVDNSGGSPGDKDIRVETTGTFEFTDSGGTQADVGALFYGSYNATVTNAGTSYNIPVGRCVEHASSTSTRVRIDGFTAATIKPVQHATAYAKLDLSGSAQADVPVLHTTRACTLVKAILLYTEASSADTGVTVTIGKEGTAAQYYTGTSEVSKSAWYEKDVTLLATAIAAGDTVTCAHAGSKVGTGEILVCIEYTVD